MTPDSHDYRLYLEGKFEGLHSLMNAHFTNVHDRLEAIEIQTTKTNGTVQRHEKLITENLPHNELNCPKSEKIDRMERAMIGEEAIGSQKKKEKEDRHSVVVRTLMAIGIAVTIFISVINAFSNRRQLSQTQDLKNEVDMINTPVRTRGGTIMWYPSGVVIDSLNKIK
jgi:hypothetical protein